MNERITQLAVEAGLLNYVDLETPRRYFVSGDAGLEEVQKFAELIVLECSTLSYDFPGGIPGGILDNFRIE